MRTIRKNESYGLDGFPNYGFDVLETVGEKLTKEVIRVAGFNSEEDAVKFASDKHNFGWALDRLRAGMQVVRSGWNGKGMWLKLQVPDENSLMSLPYIYMKTADNKRVPWLASQTDMLAEDWEFV